MTRNTTFTLTALAALTTNVAVEEFSAPPPLQSLILLAGGGWFLIPALLLKAGWLGPGEWRGYSGIGAFTTGLAFLSMGFLWSHALDAGTLMVVLPWALFLLCVPRQHPGKTCQRRRVPRRSLLSTCRLPHRTTPPEKSARRHPRSVPALSVAEADTRPRQLALGRRCCAKVR
jgi:hypothetical protein